MLTDCRMAETTEGNGQSSPTRPVRPCVALSTPFLPLAQGVERGCWISEKRAKRGQGTVGCEEKMGEMRKTHKDLLSYKSKLCMKNATMRPVTLYTD